jgi:hypothetical protein
MLYAFLLYALLKKKDAHREQILKIIKHEYLPSHLFKKYNKNKTYELHFSIISIPCKFY